MSDRAALVAAPRVERRQPLPQQRLGLERAAAGVARIADGNSMPELANIPASRMNPGSTIEALTPVPVRSSRSDSANPRSPNLVALYMRVIGVGASPDNEPMNTT